MPSKQHQKASDLFRAACEIAPDARAAFLEEACAGNTKLRAEVVALLAQDQEHPSFLEAPATLKKPSKPGHKTRTGKSPAAAAAGRTAQPEQIGPYRILEKIGEGGMGVVYVAEQREPVRRKVALKVIKLGMDTKQVLARFEVEHHALTIMNHPNIARVYDAGATPEGRPYFVMEHVPGIPIDDYCDRHLLNTRQRLELFIPVCHAVQHAHQKSVIHRDLKPSNVLVMMQDGKPVPKIIDFGVAKAAGHRLTERTLHTEMGQVIGTPEYMSPEQAEMTAIDIDTRTDIYSLGVILYELLVGAMPFDPKSLRQAGYAEIQRIIREVDPPKPSTRLSALGVENSEIAAKKRSTDAHSLARHLRGDLDWIVLKALEKDRTRRYETANGLAMDVQRHLNDEPVLASPPGAAYQLRKFVRRNRGLVAAVMMVLITLTAGLLGTAIQWRRALASERQERTAKAEAQRRTKELEKVTEFQKRLLTDMDAFSMGRVIIGELRKRVEMRLAEQNLDQAQLAAALSNFDQQIRDVNATNLALKVIDERILGKAGEMIQAELADQPLIRAALEQTVADTYARIGLPYKAMPLQESALKLRRQELGDEHPDTLSSMFGMGRLLQYVGKLDDAETYYSELLKTRRRVLGDDHPDTLASITGMGWLLEGKERYEEAKSLYEEVLERARRVLGDDDPATLMAIKDMGDVLRNMGKLEEAEPYYQKALEGRRRTLGDEHPKTLIIINRTGSLLMRMRRFDEAETYFQEVYETSRRTLGDDLPTTWNASVSVASVLIERGELDAAEPYYRQVLDSCKRVLGEEHRRTLHMMRRLGNLLKDNRRFGEAEVLLTKSLEVGRRVLGKDDTDTLDSIHNMASLLERMGKFDEAEPYYQKALKGRRRVLGEEHRDTLSTLHSVGRLLEKMGKLEEAERTYRAVLETSRRVLGDDSWRTLDTSSHLGRVLAKLDRPTEGEEFARDVVERGRTVYGEESWRLGNFLGTLGFVLTAQERYDEAETALVEGHRTLAARRGDKDYYTTQVVVYLADLYAAWDTAEPGKGYDVKAAEWRAKLPPDDEAVEPAP